MLHPLPLSMTWSSKSFFSMYKSKCQGLLLGASRCKLIAEKHTCNVDLLSDSCCQVLQVLDRIMRVDYRIPKYPRISPECLDLIQRILVGDPDKRLTIQQIQEHPWCGQPTSRACS